MMTNLERRLNNLERASGKPCPECGFDGDWTKVTYDVEWHDSDDEDDGPKETVYFATCGHPVHLVITWGDLPEEPRVRWYHKWGQIRRRS
jgi:hypothetical protein